MASILEKILYGIKVANDNILVLSDKLDDIRRELDLSGVPCEEEKKADEGE